MELDVKLYLYSDFEGSFRKYCHKFIKESGNFDARIAVLMQGGNGYEKYFQQYDEVLSNFNPREIYPIIPDEAGAISEESYRKLESATGILVCGGNMFRYIQLYSKNRIGELIQTKYNSGTPYAGISAGAILTTHLGLLGNFSIKPHFSNLHRFDELLKKMKKNSSKFGLGIDDGIRVEIEDSKVWRVTGSGSLYLFSLKEDTYCFKIYKDGDKFELEV